MKLAFSGDRFFISRHRGLVDALLAHYPSSRVVPSGNLMELLRFRIANKIAGLSRFGPVFQRYMQRMDPSPRAFALRSMQTERRIMSDRPDAVFHFFSSFSPFWQAEDVPYALYLDFTMGQARQCWPDWAKFDSQKAYEAWIALEARMYAQAKVIFTMSPSTRDSVVHHYRVPENKVLAVGGGSELQGGLTALPSGFRILFYSSREFARKGGDIAIEAFRILREQYPEAELVVVGESPWVEEPGVRFLGHVSDRNTFTAIMQSSRVVIAPSRCDPFTTFVVEAMTLGIPCVISRYTGVAEYAEHRRSAFIMEEHSAMCLALQISEILASDELAHEISHGARALVSSRLNWQSVVSLMLPRLDHLQS